MRWRILHFAFPFSEDMSAFPGVRVRGADRQASSGEQQGSRSLPHLAGQAKFCCCNAGPGAPTSFRWRVARSTYHNNARAGESETIQPSAKAPSAATTVHGDVHGRRADGLAPHTALPSQPLGPTADQNQRPKAKPTAWLPGTTEAGARQAVSV